MMKPSLSPLRLDTYFVKETHFALAPGFDRLGLTLDDVVMPNLRIEVGPGVRNSGDENEWMFELEIELPKSPKGQFPYAFSVVIVGYFTVDESYPADRVETMVRSNAPALLYSSAREFLVSLTGRSLYNAFLLPSVTFAPAAHDLSTKKLTSGTQRPASRRSNKKPPSKKR